MTGATSARRIALINPNTTATMTDLMAACVARVVDPSDRGLGHHQPPRAGIDRVAHRRGARRAGNAGRGTGRRGERGGRIRPRLLRRPGSRRRTRARDGTGRRHRRGRFPRRHDARAVVQRGHHPGPDDRTGRASRPPLRLRRRVSKHLRVRGAGARARRPGVGCPQARGRATAGERSRRTMPTRSCSAARAWPTSAARSPSRSGSP